ncbi:MAG TPA: iron chelate uptake ABC transporter family permease subunit [Solirubrobacteraceae bacterium]|nr:iron chelate uptake ABC transporter family permease subunit [Solirubrobacteraceae bacterium]
MRTVALHPIGLVFRVHTRTVVTVTGLCATTLALFVLAIGTGDYPIPPGRVVETLLGHGDAGTTFVLETLRLPRALTALLVGAALGIAGAIFQSITRNPLGSPDIIGFTAGASAAAVFGIVIFNAGSFGVAGSALAGGLLTTVAVYLLAYRGGVQGYRLVLVGIALSAMLYALIDYLMTRARIDDAYEAAIWMRGSLNGRGWEHVHPLALTLLVLTPALIVLSRPLRILEMGDDAAKALGIAVERTRLALILVGVALTAVATAAAGPIAFVALAAPQIARRLTRASGPGLGAAGAMGAALLLASDLLTQHTFSATQLPVGITTGVLGGGYLIWMLSREWKKGSS